MTPSRRFLDTLADHFTVAASSVYAILGSVLVIILWFAGGFIWGFNDTYQLIINTGTTIITFILVFAIQYSAKKDMRALHLKMDALVKVTQGADNALAGIEKDVEALERKDK
jgi:low affinity Fe/Cu permease